MHLIIEKKLQFLQNSLYLTPLYICFNYNFIGENYDLILENIPCIVTYTDIYFSLTFMIYDLYKKNKLK